jgi:hypothetical protein
MNLAQKTLPETGGAAGANKGGKINLPPVYLQAFVLFFHFTTKM